MTNIRKMLIIGSFTKGSIENFYKRGFEKQGVQVDTYGSSEEFHHLIAKSKINRVLNKISADILYRGINQRLLAFMTGKKYDVVLVFKGMELYEETVILLKKYALLLVNYNCDHPFIFYSPGSGNANVKKSIPHYDIHISYSRNIAAQLQQNFNKQAYFIPFGFDSYTAARLPDENTIYDERTLFIGAYDPERAAFLRNLNLPELDIYGDSKWKTRNFSNPYILQAYKNKSLYDEEYMTAMNRATGIINILRPQNLKEDSHNMRTFEVPGCGGLLISQRTGEQVEFFREDKEAIFFDTLDELRDKIVFLRKHPRLVSDIKKAGYNRSHLSRYDYDERSRELLDCLTPHLN